MIIKIKKLLILIIFLKLLLNQSNLIYNLKKNYKNLKKKQFL